MTDTEMLRLVRAAWLARIQDENFCPPTGQPCPRQFCGCQEEQNVIINEHRAIEDLRHESP